MIDNSDAVNFGIPKIKNGSQKKMIKWCFGFVVEDYDEK